MPASLYPPSRLFFASRRPGVAIAPSPDDPPWLARRKTVLMQTNAPTRRKPSSPPSPEMQRARTSGDAR